MPFDVLFYCSTERSRWVVTKKFLYQPKTKSCPQQTLNLVLSA